MSFVYPLGLLGLIGVPILIIIYIIKNKYTEQIIPTTYLWRLSEKFLKKKKPISLISGIVSLILQILAVVIISLLIAHPIITLPNSAKEYCFILDGSGSMNMLNGSESRIEIGKSEIVELIESSADGSKYTLVFVGDSTKVVYENLGNKEKACELLEKLEPCGITVDYKNTIKYVQECFNNNNSLVTYLITDKEYESKNINVINVANNEINYSISNLDYAIENSALKVTGSISTNVEKANLTLELFIDNSFVTEKEVEVSNLEEVNFEFDSEIIDFTTINVNIKNEDGLILDNCDIIYNLEKNHAYTTLIVSDRPFYLQSIINTIGNTSVRVVSRDQYSDAMVGYSLYIFDSFAPYVLPNDGTIWLFSPIASIEGAGFSVQDTMVNKEEGFELKYPKNSTSAFKTLTAGLEKETVYVSEYVKYGLNKNFTTLLTHESNPIIFTGSADNGCREVVFAFDLHDSNFPMLMDFILLTKNLLTYSFPVIMEESSFVCGDIVEINVLSNCSSIRVENPKGKINYLDVNKEVADFIVSEAGTYKLTLTFGNGENMTSKEMSIFVSLPEEESSPSDEIIKLSLQGELKNEYSDGIYDKLIILFIILAIIYVADWMVYCYEQYQLR